MISEKDVAHVARLARLALSEEEKKLYAGQFERILGHMDELKAVDTEGVPPTAHTLGFSNVLREDKVVSFPAEPLLKIAPASEAGYYKVRKVLE